MEKKKYYDNEFTLEVWGPMACFTRPELKVERVSYDVITPSAARAIFEAIFWKPAVHWQVTKIEVLKRIKWATIKRNEVDKLANPQKPPFFIDDTDGQGKPKNRQQRNSLLLIDVKYRISAKLEFIPIRNRMEERGGEKYKRWYDAKQDKYVESKNPRIDAEEAIYENPAKYNAMFERRAKNGQCFNQPYLGTREFSASFRFVNPETDSLDPPISETRDLGIMLYDMDFEGNPEKPDAMFFRARMENGVIIVPPRDSKEVLR